MITLNQSATYLGHRSFRMTVIVRTHAHGRPTARPERQKARSVMNWLSCHIKSRWIPPSSPNTSVPYGRATMTKKWVRTSNYSNARKPRQMRTADVAPVHNALFAFTTKLRRVRQCSMPKDVSQPDVTQRSEAAALKLRPSLRCLPLTSIPRP